MKIIGNYLWIAFLLFLIVRIGSASLLSKSDFSVRFHEKDRKLALSVQKEIDDFLPRLKSSLKIDYIPHFTVVIAGDEEEWNRMTRSSLPSWTEAVTMYHNRSIVMKSPRFSGRSMSEFITSLLHETVHIAVGFRAPVFRLPRWFNEGLAMYLTDDMHLSDKIVLSKASNSNNILDFQRIESMLAFPRYKAQLAYAEAISAVDFLVQLFGQEVISRMLDEVHRDKPFSEVFQTVTGISLIRFQLIWREHIDKKYRWLIFIETDTLLWLSFPVLLILAYISVRLRNRKIRKNWEEEEELPQEPV